MTAPLLVVGFGPFESVHDNPSGRLALAVDGARIRGHAVVGAEVPVSYRRGPEEALALVRRHRPALVLAMGVSGRPRATVERLARNVVGERPDVDGFCPASLGPGPERLATSLPVEGLAAAMGADPSDDAGTFVCNALYYRLLQEGGVPAVFVHVPPGGVSPATLRAGLSFLAERLPRATPIDGGDRVRSA